MELDDWRDKTLSFIEGLPIVKKNLNRSTKTMGLECLGSKSKSKHVQVENLQLEIVVEHLQIEPEGWKKKQK